MKLYISENIDKTIEGYTVIPVIYGEINLNNIPNNSASDIVAIDAIDSIPHNKLNNAINIICSKLRLNGTLHVGGIDIYAISRGLLSGNIDLIEYNDLTFKNKGSYTAKYIIELLNSYNLNIQSAVYKGYYYEILATRTQD